MRFMPNLEVWFPGSKQYHCFALGWEDEHYCYTTLEMEIYGFKPQIGIAFATATLLASACDIIFKSSVYGSLHSLTDKTLFVISLLLKETCKLP